ncbi:MAG: hypothetical protein JWN98_658 [Abditibacteriota bacterium]|nr:hypothetical protein [Abditibacteriota bacterium]
MSNDQNQNQQMQTDQEENDQTQHNQIASEAAEAETPLEAVQKLKQQQQATLAESRGVEARPDATSEVPGQGPPSSRRFHPQRQMYGSGTNES